MRGDAVARKRKKPGGKYLNTSKAVLALADEFRLVHAKGMDALAKGDYRAMGDAIRREAVIISRQKALIPLPKAAERVEEE